MRILHIITKLNEMYGAQRHVVESIKDHVANGHTCIVLAGEIGIASDNVKDIAEVKQIKHLKNSYNISISIKAISECIKVIETYKPDLVISHSTIAGIIARIACYKKKIPNIFTVQGWPFEIGAKWYQRLAGFMIEWFLKHISDSYLCVSNYTAEYGIRTINLKHTERIFICPNMHVKKFYVNNNPFKIFRNVLMVAGFRNQKDHITALKALSKIVYEYNIKDIHFTFVGDGPQRNNIEEFILKQQLTNYVTLVGETSNIDFYYDNCDILILPTFYEALPISIIEAIQKGKPVIATDVAGIKEMVFHNINGHLIGVKDYAGLAGHIVDYYNNDKLQELSLQSRKVYDQYFTYEKVTKKLNSIILEAIERSVFN